MSYLVNIIFLVFILSGCQTVTAPPASGPVTSGVSPSETKPFYEGEVKVSDTSFAQATGKIVYTLAEPALVRIRIGQENGALLRTFLDWEEQEKGEHVLAWDRKDQSGRVDFSSRRDISAVVFAMSRDSKEREKYKGPIQGFRKAPEVHIEFPESSQENRKGVPVVKGRVPVRISVDDKDKEWLTETKYGMVIFFDSAFVMADEEGLSPYTYILETKRLNDGPHVITVNVVAYSGEIAAASRMIDLKNKNE